MSEAPARARRSRGAARLALWLVAGTLATTALAAGAAGAASTSAGPRSLAVSVPPDPVTIAAGTSTTTAIRVINPSAQPVAVNVTGHGIRLGDNGQAALSTGADSSWQTRERFPAGPLSIPARGFIDVPLAIRVPRHVAPDLYFVGFVVTPLPSAAGNVQIVNQIGSFVTIDVPGPRQRALRAALELPGVVIGDTAKGTLRVSNSGHAAVRFWGEDDTTSSPHGSAHEGRFDPALVPVGTSRSFTVTGSPAWPIGLVTVTVRLIYPGRTEQSTKEIVLSKRVLVIRPWVAGAYGGVAAAALIFLLWRRRSTRARRRKALLAAD